MERNIFTTSAGYCSNNAMQCWLPKVMATQCFVGKSEELANSCDNPVVVFAKWESLCKVAIVHCADNKVTVELSRTTRVISCVFTISTVGGGRIKDPEWLTPTPGSASQFLWHLLVDRWMATSALYSYIFTPLYCCCYLQLLCSQLKVRAIIILSTSVCKINLSQ